MDVDVGYVGEEVEEEVEEEPDCTPSHSIEHIITFTEHPLDSYNGIYCRMDDWNREPHFETADGYHFYYIDFT